MHNGHAVVIVFVVVGILFGTFLCNEVPFLKEFVLNVLESILS